MINIMKYKIGILLICLNPHYWEYSKQMIETANKFLLKNINLFFYFLSKNQYPTKPDNGRNA